MTYLAASVAIVLFALGLKWSRAVESAGSALALAKRAVTTLLDARLGDDEKERVARASSLRLLFAAVRILGGFALAAAAALAFLGLAVASRLVGVAALVTVVESWTFLGFSTVVVSTALLWRR